MRASSHESGRDSSLSVTALRAGARWARPEYERWLRTLVEIPTISTDPARALDVRRGAEAALALLSEAGAAAWIEETGGHPLVLGELRAGDGLPTVTFYNHLDVQPAERADGWHTEPFRFVQQGERYFGRGATDDKGPALAALFGTLAARRAGLPVNVRFLWEMEEESGSPHFERTLERLAPRLATDLVVVSDGLWLARDRPSACAGFRGYLGLELRLATADHDVHSGLCGGLARNPIAELVGLLSELHEPRSGKILLPGFLDGVEPPTPEERAGYLDSGFSLRGFCSATGLRRVRTGDELEAMERLWTRPTLEVHGVRGGYAGPGSKSIVPGSAVVKASFRLVPGQRPERVAAQVESFVKARNPDVEVATFGGSSAYRVDRSSPFAAALARALAAATGKEPAFVPVGGSIGAVGSMDRVLRCPVLFLDLSLPEHGYHAPNEHFEWGQAELGIVAFARFLAEVSTVRPPALGVGGAPW
jgi:acetylornithine deacetylase/succinyl-diaminopimelate desuccinylase-like protein